MGQYDPSASSLQQRRSIYLMMFVILIFGVLLAIGSLRAFGLERGWVHAVIILACSGLFLSFWWSVLRRSSSEITPLNDDSTSVPVKNVVPDRPGVGTGVRWSWSGVVSLVVNLAVLCVLLGMRSGIWTISPRQVGQSLLAAVVFTGISVVFSLIAMSDPVPRPGRGWGLIAFLLALVNVVVIGMLIVTPV